MRAAAFVPLIAAGLLCAGCHSGGKDAGEKSGPESKEAPPTATIRTAQAAVRDVPEVVEAFGTIVPAADGLHTFSVPFEARIVRILVSEGTPIRSGTPLVEIDPSPESGLALAQAHDETTAAKEQRDLVAQRLSLKLSTRQDMLQAEQRVRGAELKEQNLERRGEAERVLRARAEGLVAHVDAQPGQLLAAGAPLLETVSEREMVVRLGVESVESARVSIGEKVRFRRADAAGAPLDEARVEVVSGSVNHDTRLVDVIARPVGTTHARLGAYVRGEIEVGRHQALVVPRDAVLPEEDHAIVFTVQDGHARRHEVRTGIDDGTFVELTGGDVVNGAVVVVQGAAELEDGMAVAVDRKP